MHSETRRRIRGRRETLALRNHCSPDLRQFYEDPDRGLKFLQTGPLQWGMDVVLAAEEVGCRQSHFRQPRAVRAAADDGAPRLDTGPAHGLRGELQGARLLLQPLGHVAVLRRYLYVNLRLWIFRFDQSSDAAQDVRLFRQPGRVEVAQEDAQGNLGDAALDAVGVEKALAALGGLRRQAGARQAVEEQSRQADGVDHVSPGDAGMDVDALDGNLG